MLDEEHPQYVAADSVFTENREMIYSIVVLRDDQLEKIREIVREEIERAKS